MTGSYARALEQLWNEGTLTGLGPGALLERFVASGDERAFEAIVAQQGPMVLGLCRRMLSDPRDVEDAFQAVFLILARKAGRLRDPSRLSNWLYGVAYKVAARARAQAARARARERPVGEVEDRRPGSASLADEVGPALDQELSRLPEKYRAAILLCYLKGRTHDQAAQELSCPVGTVRSRLARGRAILRRRLVERGCAPAVVLLDGGSIRGVGEVVAAALLSRTTRAAVQFAAFKSAPAAAGAIALTQGVLMSMKLASLKVAAITVVVAGLGVSAGGMAASRLIAGAPNDQAGVQQESPATPHASAQPQAGARSIEERMTAIEGKLDTLLSRLPAARASLTGTTAAPKAKEQEPAPAVPKPTRPVQPPVKDPFEQERSPSPITNRLIHELEARLKLSVLEYTMYTNLYERKAVEAHIVEEQRGQGLVTLATLRGIAIDLKEEIAIVKDRIASSAAQVDGAQASVDIAAGVVANNAKINERAHMISSVEVAKAEGELRVADSRLRVARADLDAVRQQRQQLESKAEAVERIIKLGKPLETREPEPAAPAKPF